MRVLAPFIAMSALRCTLGDPSPPLVVSGVTTPFLQAADPASVRPSVALCGDPVFFPVEPPVFIVVGSGFQPRVVHSEAGWAVVGARVVLTGPQTVELPSGGSGTGVTAFLPQSSGNAPPLPLGVYSVSVENDDGQTSELKDAVRIFVPPQLTASPTGHCEFTETVVTLASDGFDPASPPVVTLDGDASRPLPVRVISAQQIEVHVPPSLGVDIVQVDNMGCVRQITLPFLGC